jgi:serine/threonine protein kinase
MMHHQSDNALHSLGLPRVGGMNSDNANSAAAQQNKEYVDPEKKILRLLNQRYELKEELGKGAHGKIFSGRDKVNKSPIAVKIVSFQLLLSSWSSIGCCIPF